MIIMDTHNSHLIYYTEHILIFKERANLMASLYIEAIKTCVIQVHKTFGIFNRDHSTSIKSTETSWSSV